MGANGCLFSFPCAILGAVDSSGSKRALNLVRTILKFGIQQLWVASWLVAMQYIFSGMTGELTMLLQEISMLFTGVYRTVGSGMVTWWIQDGNVREPARGSC